MYHAFKRLIIKCIDRKVTTGKVLFDIAPDIVAQNHPVLIGIRIIQWWSTKGRHFNKFAPRVDMRQLKAATDNTATLAKDVFNLMRFGISDRVKVFWTQA